MKLMSFATLGALLSGCAAGPADSYQWTKAEDVRQSIVTKIETPLATTFCSELLGSPKLGCAVRLIGQGRCVIVIRPGDGTAAAHEAGGHCMGYDHR